MGSPVSLRLSGGRNCFLFRFFFFPDAFGRDPDLFRRRGLQADESFVHHDFHLIEFNFSRIQIKLCPDNLAFLAVIFL